MISAIKLCVVLGVLTAVNAVILCSINVSVQHVAVHLLVPNLVAGDPVSTLNIYSSDCCIPGQLFCS